MNHWFAATADRAGLLRTTAEVPCVCAQSEEVYAARWPCAQIKPSRSRRAALELWGLLLSGSPGSNDIILRRLTQHRAQNLRRGVKRCVDLRLVFSAGFSNFGLAAAGAPDKFRNRTNQFPGLNALG